MSNDASRLRASDPFNARIASAADRYWSCWRGQRELVVRAFDAHVLRLAQKYNAVSASGLWILTKPLVKAYDDAKPGQFVEMDDAIQAYWIACIYPGGVLAHAVFGMGIFKMSAVDWILRATDAELLAILPKPWLNGPILVDLSAHDAWSEASPRRQKEAIDGLIRLGIVVGQGESRA